MTAHPKEVSASSAFSNATAVNAPATSPLKPASGTPLTFPETHDRRTVVLCFDGTGDSFYDNSNVVQFFSMLKKDDPDKQVVWYHPGIGVSLIPRYITALADRFSILSLQDAAVATSLDDRVKNGYSFLVQNYKAGDKICLFGFSRGAYTARALAGMLNKVGLLPQNNLHEVSFAYDLYKSRKDCEDATRFKKAFSIDVKIEIVGVWDTVNSVGIFPSELPYSSNNSSIKHFRHAMALDEHRAKFQPDPWHEPPLSDQKRVTNYTTPIHQSTAPTDVKEVWFAGCHCDVGGGSVKNDPPPHALAKNPLRWMIRECFKTGTGIMFYTDALRGLGLDVTSPILGPDFPPLNPGPAQIRDIASDNSSRPQPNYPDPNNIENEAQQEFLDALSPIYDELSLKPWWCLAEICCFRRQIVEREPDGTKLTWTRMPNLCGRRDVMKSTPKDGRILVHRSVKTRMDASSNGRDHYPVNSSLVKALKDKNVKWVDYEDGLGMDSL